MGASRPGGVKLTRAKATGLPRNRIPDRVIDELVQVMVLEAAYAKGADVFRSASGSVLLNRSPVGV